MISTRTQAERFELDTDCGLRDAEPLCDLALAQTRPEHRYDLTLAIERRSMTSCNVLVEQVRAVPLAVELQVLSLVVMPDAVSMVNDLTRSESSTDVLLDDPAVFHDLPTLPVFPDPSADVALASHMTTEEADRMVARQGVESRDPTWVGTELVGATGMLRGECDGAVFADFHHVSIPHIHRLKTDHGKTWRPRLLDVVRSLFRDCAACQEEWAREWAVAA